MPHPHPDLERSIPRDILQDCDWRDGNREPADFLFSDGQWHQAEIRAWMTDRYGRTVVQLEWHDGGGTWGEVYLHEPGKVRRFDDAPP